MWGAPRICGLGSSTPPGCLERVEWEVPHSFTPSFLHSFIRFFIPSFLYPFTPLFLYPFTFIPSLHPFISLLLHSSTPSLSFLHFFTPSFLHSFMPSLPSCLYSLTPPFLHSFTPSCFQIFLFSCPSLPSSSLHPLAVLERSFHVNRANKPPSASVLAEKRVIL